VGHDIIVGTGRARVPRAKQKRRGARSVVGLSMKRSGTLHSALREYKAHEKGNGHTSDSRPRYPVKEAKKEGGKSRTGVKDTHKQGEAGRDTCSW